VVPMHVERLAARERVLGENIRALAADLRLIDLADLVAYLKTSQIASVGALVQASIELSFKPGTLAFAYNGDVHLEWGGRTEVALDMEFHHDSVCVHFRLILETQRAGVEIFCISFDECGRSPDENTHLLKRALQSARIN